MPCALHLQQPRLVNNPGKIKTLSFFDILTKTAQIFIFKTMKKQFLLNIILFFLLSSFTALYKVPLSFSSFNDYENSSVFDQTVQEQNKETDYMTTLLERNPEPLGLKENPVLRRYLSQPPISWAIRAKKGHILH
jgi:hypothetical protein